VHQVFVKTKVFAIMSLSRSGNIAKYPKFHLGLPRGATHPGLVQQDGAG
jgi:hypothetical protein